MKEKIQLFKSIFRGRDDVYGSGSCIRQQLNDDIILDHLKGKNRIGIYPLVNKNQTFFAVIDIDKDVPELAKEYYNKAKQYSLTTYVEKSKSKGYHCWHFFSDSVKSEKIRTLIKEILSEIKLDTEIFPKQDETDDVGNYIYLPLFNEGKDGRTVFVNPDDNFTPYANQWEILANIKKIPPEQIKSVVEHTNNAEIKVSDISKSEKWIFQALKGYHGGEGRNNACFALSRYFLSKLPIDIAWQTMQLWNSINIPPLSISEFRNTFNSALKYLKNNPIAEDEIIEILSESPKAMREIRHRLGGRITADILVKIIESLKRADVVGEKTIKTSSGQLSKKLFLLAS